MKIIHVPTLAGLTAAQLVTLSVNGANTYLGTDLVCAIRAQASGTGTLPISPFPCMDLLCPIVNNGNQLEKSL